VGVLEAHETLCVEVEGCWDVDFDTIPVVEFSTI
jgi:hypothetical protein